MQSIVGQIDNLTSTYMDREGGYELESLLSVQPNYFLLILDPREQLSVTGKMYEYTKDPCGGFQEQ